MYGINTGFGKLAGVRIADEQLGQLQRNLLLSHATGVGEPLTVAQSRLAFALRIHNLALGSSGVRRELIEQAIALWNADMIPVIPSQGSVGASGDLAPLSHMALPLIGCGEVHCDGKVLSGAAALRRLKRQPLELAEKEGLALINGTQIMTAIGCLVVDEAMRLCRVADIACAMSIEALRGSQRPFDPRVHEVRPHEGQIATAANMRALLQDSAIMESHKDCDKVQDAYSMRCSPQVHGAAKDGVRWARCLGHRGELRHGQPARLPRGRHLRRELPRPTGEPGARLREGRGEHPGQHQRASDRAAVNPDISGSAAIFG